MGVLNNQDRCLQAWAKEKGWDPTLYLKGVYEFGMNSGFPGYEESGKVAPPPEPLSMDRNLSPPGPDTRGQLPKFKGGDPEAGK